MSQFNRQESLILIGAAVAAGCRPCLENALGRAWELGVESGEIARAAELGFMAGTRARTDMEAFARETMGESTGARDAEAGGACRCSAGCAV